MPSLRAAFAASMFLLLAAQACLCCAAQPPRSGRDWPAITQETKPWTRWWWHGSAVDRQNLTSELEALRDVGIGGVEITPIYGVRGEETRFIPFLSESWVAMLGHALREAQRLDLGVDMATGTGWPFGGPWVDEANAPRTVSHRTWTLEPGQALADPIRFQQAPLMRALRNQVYEVGEIKPGEQPPTGSAQQPRTRSDVRPLTISDVIEPVTANKDLQALAIEQIKYPRLLRPVAVVAYGDSGRITDLTGLVDGDGRLNWQRAGTVDRLRAFCGSHGKLVERAAPGGEGYVIDHFSRNAIRSYLARFDRAFAGSVQRAARLLQRLVRGGRRDGAGQLDAAAFRRVPETARLRSPAAPAGAARRGQHRPRHPDAHGLSGDDLRSPARNLYDRVGRVGPQPRTRRRETRRTGPRRICSTSTPQAISPRPRGPNRALQVGDLRGECRRAAGSSRRRRPHGWANTSGRRSPTSARRSITSSSPASTTSSITARPTRPTRRRGPDGSSMPRWNSTVAMPGGTTSPR